MKIDDLLSTTAEQGASDLHLSVGIPPTIRLHGSLIPIEGLSELTPEDAEKLAFSLLNEDQIQKFQQTHELDSAYALGATARFRVNVFRQKEHVGVVCRLIPTDIPTPEDIGLSEAVKNLTNLKNGLILVTGPTGSGKSTTLAALIEHINRTKNEHIMTIEDPIEFEYSHGKSIINQREVGRDTQSFANALRAALREDPDVILVGEMRDLETIQATLTIAETGHLAFATLHTINVSQTVERVINVFPPHQQQQIRMMLSVTLRGVISQQLLPTTDGKGRVAAREILIADTAISNMIREGQIPQIYSRLQTGRDIGMHTLDASIEELYKEGKISKEIATKYLVRPVELGDSSEEGIPTSI